jgi:hypothetical protein
MKTWLIAGVLAVAGCTSFETIPRATCGNGILEPGEDCDSKDASCVRCAVVCSRALDCPTTDYACGVDGLCHAPGGAFAAGKSAGTFQASQLEITDIDHDGFGDALGVSNTSLIVRHGDSAGQLSVLDSLVTPQQTGPAALGDLDADASLDVTITTPDGLVAYTAPYGVLSPLAVESVVTGASGMPLDLRYMFRIADLAVGGFIADPTPNTDRLVMVAIEFLDPTNSALIAPCVMRNGFVSLSDFHPELIDVYQVSRESDIAKDSVVAMITGAGATAKLCVVAVHKDNILAQAVLTDITPAGAQLTKKPLLADLDTDGDRCPHLVNNDGGAPALRAWDGQMVGGHCTFKATGSVNGDLLQPIPGEVAASVAVGRVLLDPLFPFAAADALLVNETVYAFVPGTGPNTGFGAVHGANRKLAGAVNRDLNGDGLSDAILYGKGVDDLDILYRFPFGYQVLQIDTAGEVTNVTVGDYDGNGIQDIAYTERISTHQRLMIAYGTPDRPLAPVSVGEFADIASVTRIEFPDSVDVLGRAEDLAVLQPYRGVGQLARLTILHGSPQRTMYPYADPRPSLDQTTPLRASVIGNFAGSTDYRDILTIAQPKNGPPSSVDFWRFPGVDHSVDVTTTPASNVTGLAANCVANTLCVPNAVFLAWPVSGTKDVILGVDRDPNPHAAVFDPSMMTSTATVPSMLTAKIPHDANVKSLRAVDLRGDHSPDLAAVFAADPTSTSTASAVLVCRMTDGIPQSCEDIVPAITTLRPSTKTCLDAAAGHVAYRDPTITPTGATDLVVVCRDTGSTIYRVYNDASGYHAEELIHSPFALSSVRVGDVTGDGVEDVVAIEGERGAQSLIVYRQCSSRDVTTCQRTSAGSGQ